MTVPFERLIVPSALQSDGEGERNLHAAHGDASGTVAAVRVAADDREAVPAGRDVIVQVGVVIVVVAVQHPFAVDREREVVVERLRQVPPARLLRRDVDPAIEADALGLHVGGLPGRVRASEVGEVAVALERVVLEGGVTPRVRGAGSVRAVLSPLRAGVSAEADPRPGGRRVGRDGKRGRAVGYHDGRRRAGNHVRDDGARSVVTRPVRRNREVGGRRRGGCARPLRGDGRGGVARHRYHVPGEGCREVHGVRQLHVVEDIARNGEARCGEGNGLPFERRGVE